MMEEENHGQNGESRSVAKSKKPSTMVSNAGMTGRQILSNGICYLIF